MPGSLVVGSAEHKELFCRFFIDTHITFDPAAIDWPELDEGSLKLLHSLPVWAEAMETERMGTCTVQSWAELQTDPLIRQAVALQGQEEARHAAIIQGLTTRYGITLPTLPPPVPPVDAEWDFLRFGYSECFDAFFTFALFAIAQGFRVDPAALGRDVRAGHTGGGASHSIFRQLGSLSPGSKSVLATAEEPGAWSTGKSSTGIQAPEDCAWGTHEQRFYHESASADHYGNYGAPFSRTVPGGKCSTVRSLRRTFDTSPPGTSHR